MDQYQALGVSRELREAGYALMCVAFPLSDCKMETVEEDEVYEMQFGEAFSQWVSWSSGSSMLLFVSILPPPPPSNKKQKFRLRTPWWHY